ncbi:precorrin-4 C(11)-methyltransferase [Spirochaeta cellobiosiphila]|uniref:precorrin-4 C(11)-methyltransferase n=1 Tax=Spirochaeta cellobiosiphila TaxID=504483 RepID=UPI0004142FA8|nr:precorrin-4 C(11)-methyltransferase [Spirochaeta cellobiosiphila]
MKISFVGAGPGDPELITLKGHRLLQQADIIIWAGSLVNEKLLAYASPKAQIYNSASLNYEEVTSIYEEHARKEGLIVRLHTGDPSIYGAIQEQIDYCRSQGLDHEVVPGVSSFQAGAAALCQELTLPGVSQSVVLTRLAGRTPVPEGQDIKAFARTGATLVLFLSVNQIGRLTEQLKEYYPADTPCYVLYRVSWEDQKIIPSTLGSIEKEVSREGIHKHALVMVGHVLRAQEEPFFYEMSKLYDGQFSHGYRTGHQKDNS